MYTTVNYKTKKALKDAVAEGAFISIYQPGPFGLNAGDLRNGQFSVEGPWYPEPHRWYAVVTMENGKIVRVK